MTDPSVPPNASRYTADVPRRVDRPAIVGRQYRAEWVAADVPARERAERDGGAMPLVHRRAWDVVAGTRRRVAIVVGDGHPSTLVAGVNVWRSRALPTHLVWRIERLRTADPGAVGALFRFLADAARRARVLSVNVETFALPGEDGERVAAEAGAAGFGRVSEPRQYPETILIPLDASEDELFARLHATARRHVRAAAKQGLEIRAIGDDRWVSRMETLRTATYARTGGVPGRESLGHVVALARAHPTHARVLGLFRSGRSEDDALLAFVVGYDHGDHVEYATAASDRPTDIRAPLGYALAWELIRWARARGVPWFDFGGVTRGSHGTSDDPRGGISDFKRYFSTNVVTVGAEWELRPHPASARVAGLVHRVARGMRRLGSFARRSR